MGKGGTEILSPQFLGFLNQRWQTMALGPNPGTPIGLCVVYCTFMLQQQLRGNGNREHGLHSLKYLLFGLLQKKLADLCSKLLGVFLAVMVPEMFNLNDLKGSLAWCLSQPNKSKTKEIVLHSLEHKKIYNLVSQNQKIVLTKIIFVNCLLTDHLLFFVRFPSGMKIVPLTTAIIH